jgi:hypothetical protein
MTDSRRGRSSPTPARPNIARIDEHNPVWNLPGYHVDNSQSWGPISASVFSRPAGEAVWRSDYHRITYDPVGHKGMVQYENGPMRSMLPSQVAFVPRGVTARFNVSVPTQGLQIRQNPETYDSLISDMVRGGTCATFPSAPTAFMPSRMRRNGRMNSAAQASARKVSAIAAAAAAISKSHRR